MRWANFFAHRTRPRANFETNNTSAATDAGQYETAGTTARPQTATIETGNTTATEKCTKNSFFSPAKATPVSRERFPMPAGGGRARLRYPWAAARPGRATSGRPTLQTSSNQHDSNHLARTPVTNVVNLSQKTTIFSEKALGLTTFVTTRTRAPQRLNTRDPHDAPRKQRARLRCPWAVAGPDRHIFACNSPTHTSCFEM